MPHRSGRHFLQIPGPTNVPDRILRGLSMSVVGAVVSWLAFTVLKLP